MAQHNFPCRRCVHDNYRRLPDYLQVRIRRSLPSRRRSLYRVSFINGSSAPNVPNSAMLKDDVLVKIFKYLSTDDLCRCAKVCSAWRRSACMTPVWEGRRVVFDYNAWCAIDFKLRCSKHNWLLGVFGDVITKVKIIMSLVCEGSHDPFFTGLRIRRQQYDIMADLVARGNLRSLELEFVQHVQKQSAACEHKECTWPLVMFLRKVVVHLRHLSHLSIQGLPDAHCEWLLKTLQEVQSLRRLDLSHRRQPVSRQVSLRGRLRKAIPTAILQLKSLQVLKLSNIDVQDGLWHALSHGEAPALQQLSLVVYNDYNPFSHPAWERVSQKCPDLKVELFFVKGPWRYALTRSEFWSFLRAKMKLKTLVVAQKKVSNDIEMRDILATIVERHSQVLETLMFLQSDKQPVAPTNIAEFVRNCPKLTDLVIGPAIGDRRLKAAAKAGQGRLRRLQVRLVLKEVRHPPRPRLMTREEAEILQTEMTRLLGYKWTTPPHMTLADNFEDAHDILPQDKIIDEYL
uniref:F-box domain-containing protein n=1 Tax=Branchiostoma floridae TaxID=7739 RepID=C3XYB8_BRAFL|eukprot:XP_002610793.1 hypothetical protein BRAFLDRAFT_91585 [Branchiostoma floridae]